MIRYEEAVQVLRELKERADSFDRNEDSVFADYRGVASYDMREIIETLLRLDLNGNILVPGETKEGQLIGALRMLKDSAEIFDKYEDDCIEDYRNWAESEKRDIIETLLKLDLEGKALAVTEEAKVATDVPVSNHEEEVHLLPHVDFEECIANCNWIIEHAEELKALLGYRSNNMITANRVRALCALDAIRAALNDMEALFNEKTMPMRSVVDLIADATNASKQSSSDCTVPRKDWTFYNGAWIYPVEGGWEANLNGCHYDAEFVEILKEKIDKAVQYLSEIDR